MYSLIRKPAAVSVLAFAIGAAACGSSEPTTPVSDLTVGLEVNPTSVAQGGTVTAIISFNNKGTGTAQRSTAKVWLSRSASFPDASDHLLATIKVPQVAVRETYVDTATIVIPDTTTEGQTYVWVQADVGGTAAQYDRTNDTRDEALAIYHKVAVNTTARFTLAPLSTTLGDSATITGLNDSGQIVAIAWANGSKHGVLAHGGAVTDLGTCEPSDINDAGTVACVDGSIWSSGQVTSLRLDTLNLRVQHGLEINDAGEVGGMVTPTVTTSSQTCWPDCPLIWANGRTLLLDAPRISSGFVLGKEVARNRTSPGIVVLESAYHGGEGGSRWFADSSHTDINCTTDGFTYDGGSFAAIGGADEFVGTNSSGAITCKAGVRTTLGPGSGRDISRKGLVVGDLNGHGFVLYPDFSMAIIDNALTTPGWKVLHADFVNDNGQIIATATETATGRTSQVLLTQTP